MITPPISKVRIGVTALTVLLLSVLCVHLTQVSRQHRAVSRDLAELQHIKHGLLDPHAWIDQVGAILDRELSDLKTQTNAQQALRRTVVSMIMRAIETVHVHVLKDHGGNTIGGLAMPTTLFGHQMPSVSRTKQTLITTVFNGLKSATPSIADAITEALIKDGGLMQSVLRTATQHLKSQTRTGVNHRQLERVLSRNRCDTLNIKRCQHALIEHMRSSEAVRTRIPAIIVVLLLSLLTWYRWTPLPPTQLECTTLVLGCFVLLLGGLLNPMMSIEAKLNEVTWVLFEHPIRFRHQVVFFQSKSILDVVSLLVRSAAVDMKIVGCMIALFSVGFPSIKLVGALLYTYNLKGLRERTWFRVLALNSGKWSMADVFVIAIFMSYIGFGGLIDGQLEQIPGLKTVPQVEEFSPNRTRFNSGFYLFAGFCVASIFMTSLLNRITHQNNDTRNKRDQLVASQRT